MSEGKSEGDSTEDAGTKVQTGSSEIASLVKKVKKHKPAPDEDDNEEENDAHAAQEATPKKSNRGPGVEICEINRRSCSFPSS